VRSGGGLLEVLTCVGHGIIIGDHTWLVVGMLIGGGVLHPWWCCNGAGENKCGTRSGWSGGNGQFGLCSYGLEDFCELFECKKLCVAYGGKGWGGVGLRKAWFSIFLAIMAALVEDICGIWMSDGKNYMVSVMHSCPVLEQ
jgi:hypothetical protein